MKWRPFQTVSVFIIICFTFLQNVETVKPAPKCQAKFFYHILPLIANESAILNLDNLFDGYNLNFSLKGHSEWAKYIDLTQKRKLLKKQSPDTPLDGLKSYHLEKIGNSWGTSFVALRERGGRTYLSYGFLPSNTSAPVINNDVLVQNLTNTTCFDAVSFPRQNLIIIDCATKHAKNAQGFEYTNKFYYFNISDGKKNSTIENQMFIPFESITKRKLQLYTEKVSGNTYLLRSYLFDGVDEKNANNTYVDVYMMNEPQRPWVVSIIDRSFLRQSVLRATDIKVYLSEIYILDYSKGLHRVKINFEEELVYQGFYQSKGFNRFAVYSNNLDDRFELALANNHQVLQIDWTSIQNPILLTKYSLMPGSDVKQVFINERFVVLLSSSVYSQDKTQYNYTWILNRGDRTYSKAFHVMKHSNMNTFIDFNLDESYLMVIQDEQISNYAIDEVIMTMKLKRDEDFLDRIMRFTIVANSTEPTTGQTQFCQFIFNFTLVQDNNRTMWPVGTAPSPYYNANYPGKVVVPLYSYVIGPNITYKITEVKKGQLKKYKIYQQDQLKINWQKQPAQKDITFLRSQTLNQANQDTLIIYTQDKTYTIYMTYCTVNHQQEDILCKESPYISEEGELNNWANMRFIDKQSLKWHHVVAYTTVKHYNKLIVRDEVDQMKTTFIMEMGKGFEGNITNVQAYGKYLFVIRKYIKSILVYNIEKFVDMDLHYLCQINYLTLSSLGIRYFAPELIQTSQFYPNVLFIKTSDTIIVLDMNTECKPKLLSVLRPVDDTLTQFSFTLTLSHLIVTALPNRIVEYDLSRVYLKDIKMTKQYPIYGYKLPKNYDTDVSEYGNSIFITTVSEGGDYQVFIYRAGYPAVASLYDVIDLYTYEPILLDASGSFIDYVTVVSGKQMRIFRQYQIPVAEIYNPQESYQFWLQYYNVVTSIKFELISVSIINLPTNITVNPQVNDIMKTKDLLFSGPNKISQINDSNWYDGNVLTIKADCWDCQDLVTVRNHIHKQNDFTLIPGLVDYQWTTTGGTLQSYDAVLQMFHNGTVKDFVHLPQTSRSICLSTTAPYNSKFQVSACVEGEGINLYLTSSVSHKGFAFVPYSSKAQQLLKVQAVNELLILVDSSTNPFFKARPGGVILYALNFDLDQTQAFEQIQYIDFTDFPTDSDKPEYIVNADLSYHHETQTYRLYITQIVKGIYQFTLKYDRNTRKISIIQSYYINMPSLLNKTGSIPPYDATYQSVKAVQSSYDAALEQSKDLVVITTGVYHTILLECVYDTYHKLIRQTIKKFFLRYAYYVVENQVKFVNGLIVIRQTLPEDFQNPNSTFYNFTAMKSKQLITVYDINAMPFKPVIDGQIPTVGLIGAQLIMDRQPRTFDFNLTYNYSDPHPQPRVNLVVVHQFSNIIDQMSLHRNLTVYTKQTVDTQIIYLDLINDFDLKKIRILLNGWAPFPEWKLITIILFSIIGFFIILGASFVGFKKLKAYKAQFRPAQEQQRESLMTEQKSNERYSDRYSASYSYS